MTTRKEEKGKFEQKKIKEREGRERKEIELQQLKTERKTKEKRWKGELIKRGEREVSWLKEKGLLRQKRIEINGKKTRKGPLKRKIKPFCEMEKV